MLLMVNVVVDFGGIVVHVYLIKKKIC